MTIQRMDHVGIIVDDLAAAIDFFVELGLELQGQFSVDGPWVDRIVGLEDVRNDAAMLQTPDCNGLRGQLLALLRPRPRGDHRRAGRADRLTEKGGLRTPLHIQFIPGRGA
jgi:catechol 2,3-dioxygenase-like lactoylglutathione lyase family enzyme